MLICQDFARLQFDHQSLVHKKIRVIIAQQGTVLIDNFERTLLFYF